MTYINPSESCFICRRRHDNLAVGRSELSWFCLECGPVLAMEAAKMKDFDVFEQRALKNVAAKLPADNFTFPKDEIPQFIEWVLNDFAESLRAELRSNKAPF